MSAGAALTSVIDGRRRTVNIRSGFSRNGGLFIVAVGQRRRRRRWRKIDARTGRPATGRRPFRHRRPALLLLRHKTARHRWFSLFSLLFPPTLEITASFCLVFFFSFQFASPKEKRRLTGGSAKDSEEIESEND